MMTFQPVTKTFWQRHAASTFILALAACATVAYWAYLGMLAPHPTFPVDDAYIVLRASQEVRGVLQPNFIDSNVLSGVTSPVHVALVALGSHFLSPELALSLVCLAGYMLYQAGVWTMARVRGTSVAVSCLLVLLGATLGMTPHHAANGLETSIALASVTWAIHWATAPARNPADWRLALLLGSLPFIRPDLAIVALGLAISALVGTFHTPMVSRRTATTFLLLALVGALPWLVALVVVNGTIIPNTIAAKKLFFAEGCAVLEVKANVVMSSLSTQAKIVGPFVIALLGLLVSRAGWILLLAISVTVGLYLLQLPGALSHYEGRYLYPLAIPAAIFGLSNILANRRLLSGISGGTVIAISLAFNLTVSAPTAVAFAAATRKFTQDEIIPVTEWLAAHGAPGSLVAVHDAGYPGWALPSHFKLLDLVGLKTASAARQHEITWESCGRRRKDALSNVMRSSRPDFVVILNSWDRIFRISNAIPTPYELQRNSVTGYAVYRTLPSQPATSTLDR